MLLTVARQRIVINIRHIVSSINIKTFSITTAGVESFSLKRGNFRHSRGHRS